APPATPAAPPPDPQLLTTRAADGTYNDLSNPAMGSAGRRFGRNVPISATRPDPEPKLLTPNPRDVSLQLLGRDTFIPATTLNLHAAAWLQFMIRGWLSHGENQRVNPWQLPLRDDDPWPERPMTILRAAADQTRSAADADLPPTWINKETCWWDASQIYGSSKDFQAWVRSGNAGKLNIGPDSALPLHPEAKVQAALGPGWWLGLSLMQTLFTLEHNAICDRLKAEYPGWSDEDLFQRARLINAALLAKIHTVEWTPAILGHPTLQLGMRANWWGLEMERLNRLVGRLSSSEVISGIPGSETNHFGVPYSLTEEFVAVYRMHPLVPDEFHFRAVQNDAVRQEREFPDIAGIHAQEVLDQLSLTDVLYSFGTAHPGAITLHNFPKHLQRFVRPDGVLIDLAATDILRARERGVPRYNRFRQFMHRPPVRTFADITPNPAWQEQLRQVYGDVDGVDVMVGLYAENPPAGFGFSDTAFRIFILMASRRLNSDRFYTNDYNERVYTPAGMEWINSNTFGSVVLRHCPALGPALRGNDNAFAPWIRTSV
ncbi:MAG TPA: peroxidase family protein, partial [Chloroflexota bacterium]